MVYTNKKLLKIISAAFACGLLFFPFVSVVYAAACPSATQTNRDLCVNTFSGTWQDFSCSCTEQQGCTGNETTKPSCDTVGGNWTPSSCSSCTIPPGTAGFACTNDLSCNNGLHCDPNSKICVAGSTQSSCATLNFTGQTCCNLSATDPICVAFKNTSTGTDCQDTGLTGQECCNNFPSDPVCVAFKGNPGTTPGPNGGTIPCNTGQALCLGATGPDVGNLQDALNAQSFGPITKDCIYGVDTQAAVVALQKHYNVNPADGKAGPQTLPFTGVTLTGPANGPSCKGTSATGPGPAGGSAGTNGSSTCPWALTNGICLPPNPYGNGGIAGSSTLFDLLSKILKALLFLSGIIAVVFIIVGGFWYMTSAGNEEQSEKGKKALISSILGLLIVILAYVIVSVITTTLTGGVANTQNANDPNAAVNKLLQ